MNYKTKLQRIKELVEPYKNKPLPPETSGKILDLINGGSRWEKGNHEADSEERAEEKEEDKDSDKGKETI